MTTCLVYYGTSEGQTAKIALRIRDRLAERGVTVELVEAPASVTIDPEAYDAVVIGDSIHAGHYHRPVLKTVKAQQSALAQVPTAFFSVCLSADSDDPEKQAESKAYVHDMIEATGWQPDRVGIFAGALKYSQYGLIKRWMMSRIADKEGGDSDPSYDYEYTNWNSVDAFAEAFAEELQTRLGGRDEVATNE